MAMRRTDLVSSFWGPRFGMIGGPGKIKGNLPQVAQNYFPINSGNLEPPGGKNMGENGGERWDASPKNGGGEG